MAHDFSFNIGRDIQIPRFSSNLTMCNRPEFYMAYGRNPNQWSPCSVEDFTLYYNMVKRMSFGKFCLPTIDIS